MYLFRRRRSNIQDKQDLWEEVIRGGGIGNCRKCRGVKWRARCDREMGAVEAGFAGLGCVNLRPYLPRRRRSRCAADPGVKSNVGIWPVSLHLISRAFEVRSDFLGREEEIHLTGKVPPTNQPL